MSRLPDLTLFAERHGLLLVTIEDLIAYLKQSDSRGGIEYPAGHEIRSVA
jgi:3,4-dihydroxy 2-butanone 4-phosphate synthase